ncbi:hypothetical protein PtA15_11A185 [Puccinia triticina]|uniref:Uncharacterized protein n=1 Tax=Puccinia triticina TaxID=208348 RepID=A0ABY7CW37_9BASI|nr:uncharacterized protein PtA15_11A185 [Puccinia triticina]WAQ89496.1 hypothetical protein PtA15_11A185 [Puccinia triticina]
MTTDDIDMQSSSTDSSPCPSQRSLSPEPEPSKTLATKTLECCNHLKSKYNLTPKKFIVAFLTGDNDTLAFCRRYWGTRDGWPSTLKMIQTVKEQVIKTRTGEACWLEFIKNKAIQILNNENPPTGDYPGGCFQSSQTVEPSFFDHDAACTREELLTQVHMPFLFDTVMGTLQPSNQTKSSPPDDQPLVNPNVVNADKNTLMELEDIQYQNSTTLPCWMKKAAAVAPKVKCRIQPEDYTHRGKERKTKAFPTESR